MTMSRYHYEATIQEAANLAVAHVLKEIGVDNLDQPTRGFVTELMLKHRIGDEDLRITNLRYDIAFSISEATYDLTKEIDADEEADSADYERNRPDRLLSSQLV